jgi:hypothetical protein
MHMLPVFHFTKSSIQPWLMLSFRFYKCHHIIHPFITWLNLEVQLNWQWHTVTWKSSPSTKADKQTYFLQVADGPTIEVRTQLEVPYLNLGTMTQCKTHLQPPDFLGIPVYYVAIASLIGYFSFWRAPGEQAFQLQVHLVF